VRENSCAAIKNQRLGAVAGNAKLGAADGRFLIGDDCKLNGRSRRNGRHRPGNELPWRCNSIDKTSIDPSCLISTAFDLMQSALHARARAIDLEFRV